MILINSSPKDALKIFQPFLPIYVPKVHGLATDLSQPASGQTSVLSG